MDILIKSFNRPYCLDRCIQSIKKFVVDSEYQIIVLDDGTPEKYLKKIKEKHDGITILKSSKYDEKVTSIENSLGNVSTEIPIDLWLDTAKKASDYFLLLEDDIWLTDCVALSDLQIELSKEKVQMLKLFWLGNPKLISNKIIKKDSFFSIYQPQLYTQNPLLYRFIFIIDRFKIRRFFSFFNIYTTARALRYYAIYSVAGAVFKRDYFLSLWNNHTNTVSEELQLYNAVKFLKSNKNVNFGRTNKEIVKTSFLSAATNQHKNYENVNLDMFAFNKIVNDAWYENQFDAMDGFPKDLNPEIIDTILKEKNATVANAEEWNKWVKKFKFQYTSFGCTID